MPEVYNSIAKVRKKNESIIRSFLKESESGVTTAQISKETGISVVTCGKIIAQLCAKNEVIESDIEHNSLGRPSKLFTFNANFSYIAIIYAETDHNKITLVTVITNLQGEIIEQTVYDHLKKIDYGQIHSALLQLITKFPQIAYVSIGIPGYICNGTVSLCNFVDLMGVPLQQALQDSFPNLQISVENDMNATAYGFYQSNYKNQDTTVAVIYSPNPLDSKDMSILKNTGIEYGAGFVSAGQIIHGFSGFAGEVSFLPNLPSGNTAYENQIITIAYIINCIIPVLNPVAVALTGSRLNDVISTDIRKLCLRQIAPQHMPEIIIRPDFHTDYVNGLINLALDHYE